MPDNIITTEPADDSAKKSPPSMYPSYLLSFLIITKNIFLILIGSYGLSVSLHILLRFMVDKPSNLIAFFNTFAHLLWMPALVLFPLLLIARHWRVAFMLILPVIMFITTYGELFLPRQSLIPVGGTQIITLQTHNVLAKNRTPHHIPSLIEDISADIVAMQEVSLTFAHQFDDWDIYPYKAIHGVENDGTLLQRETMGQAILSRYPILEDEYWVYDFLPLPLAHQRVVIDVNGQQIVIYNLHPTHPGMAVYTFFDISFRRQEYADLVKRIRSETLPVIMIGDLNITDLSYEYGLITSLLSDTHREVGQGMGFTFPDFQEAYLQDSMAILPDNFPDHLPTPLVMRLDYVFHSEEFRGVSTYVHHTSGGSDHRPLVVTLTLDS